MNKLRQAPASRCLLAAALLAVHAMGAAAEQEAYRAELRAAVERLRDHVAGDDGAPDAASGKLVIEFFERRDFRPAWRNLQRIDSLIALLGDAYDDGLAPDEYGAQAILELSRDLRAGRVAKPEEWAATELMLTDVLVKVTYHLRFGRVDPLLLDPAWNYPRPVQGLDVASMIGEAAASPSLAAHILRSLPRGPSHDRLRRALAKYRAIAAAGGWPELPDGPTLRPGDTDSRIGVLALRLSISGDIEGEPGPRIDAMVYDDFLEAGVRRFQSRHGLLVDGIVGAATRRELNVPAEHRVEQLRLSLERARWVMGGLGEDFLVVNIAGFRAYVVSRRELVWETSVVVGKPHQQTPVFRDELQYVVFNPDWTVPYSIATREMLPLIQADPGYLQAHNIDVRDPGGAIVDPASVDWPTVTRRTFNYRFVQRPGANNALGRIKFIFPNEFAVYLHDTPRRDLFGSPDRAFSHGCIRVADPLRLAELLLGRDGWDRARIDAAVASGKTTNVYLSQRLPILLLYWTASVDPDGLVHFYRDVYRRDPPLLAALAE